MAETIAISRSEFEAQVETYMEKKPAHVFVIEIKNPEQDSLFKDVDQDQFWMTHVITRSFLDIPYPMVDRAIAEGKKVIDYDDCEALLNFVMRVKNAASGLPKEPRIIVVCNNGRTLSGSVATFLSDILCISENELERFNPDIKPNEYVLSKLFLHPII